MHLKMLTLDVRYSSTWATITSLIFFWARNATHLSTKPCAFWTLHAFCWWFRCQMQWWVLFYHCKNRAPDRFFLLFNSKINSCISFFSSFFCLDIYSSDWTVLYKWYSRCSNIRRLSFPVLIIWECCFQVIRHRISSVMWASMLGF